MASSDNTINILLRAQDRASGILRQAALDIQRNIDNVSGSSRELGRASEEGGSGVQKLGLSMGSFIKGAVVAGVALALRDAARAVEEFVSSSFAAAGKLEQSNMAFQSLIGNATQANTVFGQLVQYANVTPFQSKDIVQAAQTLMGFGTAGQQTVDVIKQLGDVVSTSGGDLNALALVTGQVFAQGKCARRTCIKSSMTAAPAW